MKLQSGSERNYILSTILAIFRSADTLEKNSLPGCIFTSVSGFDPLGHWRATHSLYVFTFTSVVLIPSNTGE